MSNTLVIKRMPNHFDWVGTMSVGKGAIDGQHKKLLSQLERVYAAVASDISNEEIMTALSYFERYIKEHFAYEEQYMQQRGYRRREEHIAMHKSFNEEFDAFKYELETNVMVSVDKSAEMQRLGQLLIDHMRYEDRKYHATFGMKE